MRNPENQKVFLSWMAKGKICFGAFDQAAIFSMSPNLFLFFLCPPFCIFKISLFHEFICIASPLCLESRPSQVPPFFLPVPWADPYVMRVQHCFGIPTDVNWANHLLLCKRM
jgi:hypothetical protein